jgi:transposase
MNGQKKMAQAYSQDLRERALEAFYQNKPISEICELFKITSRTLLNWRRTKECCGRTCARKDFHRGLPPKIQDLEKFRKFVEEGADRTTAKMAEDWGGVSPATIQRALKRIGFTRKKRPMDTQNAKKKHV